MAKGKRVAPHKTPDFNKVFSARLIGEAIRAKRTQLGIDERTAALMAGVSHNTLRSIEEGKEGTSIGKIVSVLTGLGIKIRIEEWESDASNED